MREVIIFLPAMLLVGGMLVALLVAFVSVVILRRIRLARRPSWLARLVSMLIALCVIAVLGGAVALWAVGLRVGWVGRENWSEGNSPQLREILRRHAEAFVRDGHGVGVVIGAVHGDETALAAFGRQSLFSAQAVDGDTVFEIGSITKTFTSLLAAIRIEDGRLSLDAPLHEMLGTEASEAARAITLRHVVTHTSGLPRLPGEDEDQALAVLNMAFLGGDPYAGLTEEDYLKALRKDKLESSPGSEVEYSNLAVTLLGLALARQSGRDYADLVEAEICRPLGMSRSEAGGKGTAATGYRVMFGLGALRVGLRSAYWNDARNLEGAGGLRSTGRDMLRYLLANMHPSDDTLGKAMRRAHEELFVESESQAWGMGWGRWKRKKTGRITIWHNGATGGFSSFLGFTAERRQGVFILSNISASTDEAAAALLKELASLNP